MDAVPKILVFYEPKDGTGIVSDWLDEMASRDQTTYDRIIAYLERVEDGNTSNFKPEGEGVTELVMDFGPGYRIYFGQHDDDLIILLVGGLKGDQKRDLARAKNLWKEFNAS